MKPGEGDFDEVDRDASLRTILGVEPISNMRSSRTRLVRPPLDRQPVSRSFAFIAGDAAHIWVPYAATA